MLFRSLGGGLRGQFVLAPPAPAAPAQPAARRGAADPWADEPPPQRAAPKRPSAPTDWQGLGTEAGVAAPLGGHIATRNAWALLDEDEDGADDADAENDGGWEANDEAGDVQQESDDDDDDDGDAAASDAPEAAQTETPEAEADAQQPDRGE